MLRVKDICKRKKITLKALAEKMDIAPESLNRMISPNGNPTLASLTNIGAALDVQVYELFSEYDADKNVRGYLEVGGKIYRVNNFGDLHVIYEKCKSL